MNTMQSALPLVLLSLAGCQVLQTEAHYQAQQQSITRKADCVVMHYHPASVNSPERAELLRVLYATCLTRGKST